MDYLFRISLCGYVSIAALLCMDPYSSPVEIDPCSSVVCLISGIKVEDKIGFRSSIPHGDDTGFSIFNTSLSLKIKESNLLDRLSTLKLNSFALWSPDEEGSSKVIRFTAAEDSWFLVGASPFVETRLIGVSIIQVYSERDEC